MWGVLLLCKYLGSNFVWTKASLNLRKMYSAGPDTALFWGLGLGWQKQSGLTRKDVHIAWVVLSWPYTGAAHLSDGPKFCSLVSQENVLLDKKPILRQSVFPKSQRTLLRNTVSPKIYPPCSVTTHPPEKMFELYFILFSEKLDFGTTGFCFWDDRLWVK